MPDQDANFATRDTVVHPPRPAPVAADETTAPKSARPATPGPAPTAQPGYDILEEIGRGGMGVVYKARHLALNRVVALKRVLTGASAGDEDRRRFRVEAEAAARLSHANIVQVYEVGEHEGVPFVALEFVGGDSLRKALDGTPQAADEAAALAETLSRAMHHAHERGVVHRDLKPANVLLSSYTTYASYKSYENLALKIADFGLAKLAGDDGQTRTGAIVGTPSYMAPEQAEGKKNVGPLADVWALGAILYESLTGRPPFKSASMLETLELVRTAEPAGPRLLVPTVPRDLETIALKCLQKDPARRYASAAELADDLARFRAGEPIRARPVGAAERAGRWARRNPGRAALSAAVVVLLLGLTAVSVAAYLTVSGKNRLILAESAEKERQRDLAERRY